MPMELLAPAGDIKTAKLVLSAGADAVYVGGASFSARAFAINFDDEALGELIAFARPLGRGVHVAVNTMLLPPELGAAMEYLAHIYEAGADAAIVADVGLASLAASRLPGLALHASTQMGLHNAAGARFALSLGMKRVVPSRECSIETLAQMAATGIEVEAFCHGALCTAFSGACLMSGFIGARSGNRGKCAQPCRLPYSMDGGPEAPLLSTSDLCAVGLLSRLKAAGVCSLKIEGRMKSPDYAAMVTHIYRLALDGEISEEKARSELQKLTNRGRFCEGWLTGGRSVTNPAAEDRTDMSAAREYIAGLKPPKIPAQAVFFADESEASLIFSAKEGSYCASAAVSERAQNPAPDELIASRLKKTGDTPFELEKVTIGREGAPHLPASLLNSLRREAARGLEAELSRVRREPVCVSVPEFEQNVEPEFQELFVQCRTREQAAAALAAGAQRIIYAPADYSHTLPGAWLLLPPFMAREDEEALAGLCGEYAGAYISNPSQIEFARGHFPQFAVDFPANAANPATVAQYLRAGACGVTRSAELCRRDMRMMPPGEAVIYGRFPLMCLVHCPVRRAGRCPDCEKIRFADRTGAVYPLSKMKIKNCLLRLLNPVLSAADDLAPYKNASALRIMLHGESPQRAAELTREYKKALGGGRPALRFEPPVNRGHLDRGV